MRTECPRINGHSPEEIEMSKINQSAAFSACDAFAGATDDARAALCASLIAAGVLTREDASPIITAWAAQKEMFTWDRVAQVWVSIGKCGLVAGQKKASGTMVLDRSHRAFDAAVKTRNRVLDAFAPTEARVERQEAAAAAAEAASVTVKKATKAEREAHAVLQAARAAFLAACGGNKPRAKAVDAALSA